MGSSEIRFTVPIRHDKTRTPSDMWSAVLGTRIADRYGGQNYPEKSVENVNNLVILIYPFQVEVRAIQYPIRRSKYRWTPSKQLMKIITKWSELNIHPQCRYWHSACVSRPSSALLVLFATGCRVGPLSVTRRGTVNSAAVCLHLVERTTCLDTGRIVDGFLDLCCKPIRCDVYSFIVCKKYCSARKWIFQVKIGSYLLQSVDLLEKIYLWFTGKKSGCAVFSLAQTRRRVFVGLMLHKMIVI